MSYGNHLSTVTGPGCGGMTASFSMMTRLGGGGILTPGTMTVLGQIGSGGVGGFSLITTGGGLHGWSGIWRIIIGGAGAVGILASCLITIGPGVGGLGGFKYLSDNGCTLSTQSYYIIQLIELINRKKCIKIHFHTCMFESN